MKFLARYHITIPPSRFGAWPVTKLDLGDVPHIAEVAATPFAEVGCKVQEAYPMIC